MKRIIPPFILSLDLRVGIILAAVKICSLFIDKIPLVGKFIAAPIKFVANKLVTPAFVVLLVITVVFVLFGLIKRFIAKKKARDAQRAVTSMDAGGFVPQQPVSPMQEFPSQQPISKLQAGLNLLNQFK